MSTKGGENGMWEGGPGTMDNKSSPMMPTTANNIKVYVRVRPLSKEEMARGDSVCIHVTNDNRSVKVVEQGYGYNETTRSFQFDGCIGPEAEQAEVMDKVGMNKLLDKVLKGYSSTVMACGQTGSGKTFTMSGREEDNLCNNCGGDNGLIARSATYLFEAIKRRSAQNVGGGQNARPYTMRASYFEIYTEQVNDLLRLEVAPRDVKWSSCDGFYVENLLLVDCDTVDDVFSVLNEGAKNRKVGSHELNKDSSRSHCIMTLHVDSVCPVHNSSDGPPIIRYGRMLFVDLAGSERLKKSKSSGEMLRETGGINRSLFTLGKVIYVLSEGKKGDVVPYRESLLTKLLMESLGGRSLALMIACVSPSTTAVAETLSTLHYATCANNIVNAPSVNLDVRDKIVMKLQNEIAHLKEENNFLRSKLAENNVEVEFPSSNIIASPPASSTKRGQHTARHQSSLASPDKWPLELNGIEKHFAKDISSKDFAKKPSALRVFGNFRDHSQPIDCEASGSSILDASSSRCLLPSQNYGCSEAMMQLKPTQKQFYPETRGTPAHWDDEKFTLQSDYNIGMTPCVHSEPRCLESLSEHNSLLGMYRGLANSKAKGLQQISRRNRVSVDHLGGNLKGRIKNPSKNRKQDPQFQGSITVNQSKYLRRLLDLNISPSLGEDMVNF